MKVVAAGLEARRRGVIVAPMWRILLVLALLTAGSGGPALAADTGPGLRSAETVTPRLRPLPFPRGERAASVWDERACWTDCQSYCTWGAARCLEVDAQGRCLTLTDRCDRICQRECRGQGGPLLAPLLGLLD
jgi:hypothetical protein